MYSLDICIYNILLSVKLLNFPSAYYYSHSLKTSKQRRYCYFLFSQRKKQTTEITLIFFQHSQHIQTRNYSFPTLKNKMRIIFCLSTLREIKSQVSSEIYIAFPPFFAFLSVHHSKNNRYSTFCLSGLL